MGLRGMQPTDHWCQECGDPVGRAASGTVDPLCRGCDLFAQKLVASAALELESGGMEERAVARVLWRMIYAFETAGDSRASLTLVAAAS